jgi:hypothetical protein
MSKTHRQNCRRHVRKEVVRKWRDSGRRRWHGYEDEQPRSRRCVREEDEIAEHVDLSPAQAG